MFGIKYVSLIYVVVWEINYFNKIELMDKVFLGEVK